MSWSCIKNIANNHRRIVHMSFSPLDEWFAYAEQFKVYLYALHQEQEQIDPIKTYICPESINALIFDENENLIIQTSKGFLAIQQLFVWKFGSQNNVSSCTVWQDTAKIVLRQDRSCDLLINADEISTIAHQIMFKSQLANIKTCAQLEHFKKYANTLRCEEQPLFKLIAITNKAAELHKSLEQK